LEQEIYQFFKKIESIQQSNLPFVVYRKPNETKVLLLVQKTDELHYLNSYKEGGFVFAPFKKNDPKIIFPFEKCETFQLNISDINLLQIVEKNSEIVEDSNIKNNKTEHINLVENAIASIQKGTAKKIVVSRKESVCYSNFKAISSFKKMLKIYSNAFVYWWFHPKGGCWMGASPEQFINIQQMHFKTMSLAATQSYNGTLNVTWKHKEQQEQQFVTDYILTTIENSVSTIEITKPTTVKAGNLLHIRTDISAELLTKNSLENLIEALHPTPAICGLPKEESMRFIIENEGYERSYYAGFLGELNLNNNTNLFVNLRCMEQTTNGVAIYIGGGITAESDAEKEWEETVFKAEVMKKVL
jgi:isochorismate synthase